jgi:hypothetical protein
MQRGIALMAKKQKKGNKQRRGSGVTPLEGHVRHKKTLKPPLLTLNNFQFTSWVNSTLPNILWSALKVSPAAKGASNV